MEDRNKKTNWNENEQYLDKKNSIKIDLNYIKSFPPTKPFAVRLGITTEISSRMEMREKII